MADLGQPPKRAVAVWLPWRRVLERVPSHHNEMLTSVRRAFSTPQGALRTGEGPRGGCYRGEFWGVMFIGCLGRLIDSFFF